MVGADGDVPGLSHLWVEGDFDGVVAQGLGVAMAMISPEGPRIVYTNQAWDELFGFEPGEAVGQSANIVSADPPEQRDDLQRALEASLAQHGAWHGRVRKVRKSGEEFWSMTHVTTVQHLELGEVWVSLQTGLDLGEGSPTDDLLEELANVGSWQFDVATGTAQLSSETLRLMGMDDVQGPIPVQELLARFAPEDVALIAEAMRESQDGSAPDQVQVSVLLPDGGTRRLVFRGAQVQSTDGARVFRGVAYPIGEVGASLVTAALLDEQMRSAELEELDEQKNLFLRAVSHDLRTPLTVIQGFASILATQGDRLDPIERRHYAERIEAGARRLQRQLNDLLDLDRLSRGVISSERQPTDLRRVAVDVVEALDLAHRVTVQGESVVATVDPAQVERIIENLLANAARHTGPECRVEFRAEPFEGGVLILVDDEGPGVPPELREEVFDVFHKGHVNSSGTGVGLPLVRRFAELHGGRAWVEERDGGGAAFRVFLPNVAS